MKTYFTDLFTDLLLIIAVVAGAWGVVAWFIFCYPEAAGMIGKQVWLFIERALDVAQGVG